MSSLNDLAVSFPPPGTYDYDEAAKLLPDIFYVGSADDEMPVAWRPSMSFSIAFRDWSYHNQSRQHSRVRSPSGHGESAVTFEWDGTLLHFHVQLSGGRGFTVSLTPVVDRVKNEIVRRTALYLPNTAHHNQFRSLDIAQLLVAIAGSTREECVAAWVQTESSSNSKPSLGSWRTLLEALHERHTAGLDAEPLKDDQLDVFCTLGLDNWEGSLETLYQTARALGRTGHPNTRN